MKKLIYVLLVISLVSCGGVRAGPYDPSARAAFSREVPELRSFLLLKADFHLHTVYSDGRVLPSVRVEEAFREGLDAIAITDHIEGYPEGEYAGLSHNAGYEEALTSERINDVIVIKGAEITRGMPPGHFNALYLTDTDPLDTRIALNALSRARDQGAFLIFNHPGWEVHLPDETLWFPMHTLLLEQGMMHGIEVANGNQYFLEAHQWALERNLTMIGGSDAHAAIRITAGNHRTMTLVFARERTSEAIHEALLERRTAVYFNHFVIGEDLFLREILERSLEISVTTNGDSAEITIKNNSDFMFRLMRDDHDPRLSYFRNVNIVPYTIRANTTHTIPVRLNDGINGGDVNFIIENFLVGPNIPMKYTIKI